MSEQNPATQNDSPEQQSSHETQHTQETCRQSAENLISIHASEVSGDEKQQLIDSLTEKLEQVFADNTTKEEQVAAVEQIIVAMDSRSQASQTSSGTPEQTSSRTEQGPRPQGVPTTAEVSQQAAETESNKGKYGFRRVAKAALGMVTLGVTSAATRQNLFKRQREESWEEYDKRTKKHAWIGAAGIAVAGAAYIGWNLFKVKNGIDASGATFDPADTDKSGSVSPEERTAYDRLQAGDLDKDGMLNARENALLNGFGYDWSQDPFNDTEKQGVHNFGNELGAHVNGEEHAVGLDDLTENRWKDSPEQFATAAAEMGLEGFRTDNIEEMAEQLKSNPELYESSYNKLMEIVNSPDTKFSIGTLESGTYGSYYETGVDQNGVISYDNNIAEAGTTIKIDYKDAQGNWHTVEFKRECGGQVIHRNPVAAEQPVYYGTGGAAPVIEQPVYQPTYTEPTGEGGVPPARPEVPEEPEVPVTPEVPEEPETPEEPEIPVEPPAADKDTSLTPDLDGLTPRGLEGVITEHPGGYDPAVDAPVTEETGPTIEEDLGTEVGVDGADTTETNQNSNPVEEGVNPESTDGETPRNDPTFNPDNI